MRLIEPNMDLKNAYLAYISEWEETGERIVPYVSRKANREFEQLLEIWQEDKTDTVYDKGFVPATLYFLIDQNGRIIGSLHIRHELNDKLLLDGGHIGYGIRPTERGKGYATLMLGLAIEVLREKGYEKVLVTCDDWNTPSSRVIEKNGGILENIVDVDGDLTKRYWISI